MFIFKRVPAGQLPEYYSVSNGCHEWSKDKEIAYQFGREVDAQNMRRILFPAPKLTIEIVPVDEKKASIVKESEPEETPAKATAMIGGKKGK